MGLEDGLASIRLTGGNVEDEGNFLNLPKGKRVDRIVARADDRIWLATVANGVLRVDAEQKDAGGIPDRNAAVHEYYLGPTDRQGIEVFELSGKLLFASGDLAHLFRLNEARDLYPFTPLDNDDPLNAAAPDPNVRGFGFQEDSNGNVWTYRGRDLIFLARSGETYAAARQPIAHAAGFGSLSVAFPDAQGVI